MTAITILMAAHSKAKNWDPARMGKMSVEVLLALGLACSVSPRSGKEEPRLAAIELFPGEELVCARLDREREKGREWPRIGGWGGATDRELVCEAKLV